MFNTINPMMTELPKNNSQSDSRRKIHRRLVSDTGYAAMGFGTLCGIAGFKKVKIPNRIKFHKISAYIAAGFTALHFAFVKGLDKLFYKKV